MGIFARSLGLARVTPAVGGYAFANTHSLSGSFSTISSDPWIARRDAQHGKGTQARSWKSNGKVTAVTQKTVVTAEI